MPTSRVRARMVVLGEIAPLAKHGNGTGDDNSRRKNRVDNINSVKGGTDTEYTLRRPVELLPCCFSLQSCDSGPAAAADFCLRRRGVELGYRCGNKTGTKNCPGF